jgi:tight adherence protein C
MVPVLSSMQSTGLLGALGVGAAIALALWTVGAQADEKATVRDSLRHLGGYEVENVRDKELLAPVKVRAVAPVLQTMTDLGRRLTVGGYVDSVRQRFVYAGEISPDAVDRFLAMRFACLVFGVLFATWCFFFSGLGGFTRLGGTALGLAGGWVLPDNRLNAKVNARQHAIQIKLPDVMDLLTISVEAGLGFEQAIDRVVAAVPGPLTDEFGRMLGETRAGSSRADAMRALQARCNIPEIRSFVMAMLQADTFGVSIGKVLRAQADEMRIRRRQAAEEKAMKAPVKMLIPMVFCIFPALFMVVLGPAVMNISKTMG